MIVTGPYSADSQSVNVAAILSELAILVLVTYFFLHYRAAKRADVLSAPGSLFDTLWAHWLGCVFYLAMLLVPAIAALHLALNMSGSDRTVALTIAIGSGLLTVSLAVSFIEGFLARSTWDWLRALRLLPRRRKSRVNEKD
jgi:putative exporter of polyketide antibiotics